MESLTPPHSTSPLKRPSPGARTAQLAEIAKSLEGFSEQQLRALIRSIEPRLGTPFEREGDFDHVRVIAHQLNNLLTVKRLKAELASLDGHVAAC